MAKEYRLLSFFTAVLRTADNAVIPFNPESPDYKAYLAWVASGNEPDPPLPEAETET